MNLPHQMVHHIGLILLMYHPQGDVSPPLSKFITRHEVGLRCGWGSDELYDQLHHLGLRKAIVCLLHKSCGLRDRSDWCGGQRPLDGARKMVK